MASNPTLSAAWVSVVLVALSVACAPAPTVPDVEVQPRDWKSDKLRVTCGDHPVSVWLCDFKARKSAYLTFRVHAIQSGKSECLGEVSAGLAEQSKGCVYLASTVAEGRDEIPYEIGVAGDGTRRHLNSPLTRVDLPADQKLNNTLNQYEPIEITAGEEKVLRVVLYRSEQSTQAATVQELLSSSPFPSFSLADIKRKAESFKDATTILITVQLD